MPLHKHLHGRRIKRTKRHGDRINVKLAGKNANAPPEWINIPLERYKKDVRIQWNEPG